MTGLELEAVDQVTVVSKGSDAEAQAGTGPGGL